MSSDSARPAWIWPLALVVIAAMAIGAALYVFRTLSRAPGAAVEEGRRVIEELRGVAAAFRTGTISTSFVGYASEVTGVSRLQLAELRQTEIFEQTDEASVLWGQLQLPTLVVRARAPMEYTYYVDLEEPWDFRLTGQRIRVEAPEIRFTRPAVDVSELDYEVAEDNLLRDEEQALERLRAGLSQMALRRAADNIPLIRELARREAEEFVRVWLAARFVDGDDFTVDVVFADERLSLESESGRS